MALGDIIAKLLEMLGLKKTQKDKYAAMEQKLRSSKAENVDRLESLKEQIAALERQAKQKKKEYDAAVGDSKRIVSGEIERIFAELDRIKNRESIIGQNINKLSLAIAKLSELRDAQAQGVDQDVMDDLAVELEDIFADYKATDRAAEALDKVTYEPKQTQKIDIESRMSALEVQAQPKEALSESSAKRLKELANEEE